MHLSPFEEWLCILWKRNTVLEVPIHRCNREKERKKEKILTKLKDPWKPNQGRNYGSTPKKSNKERAIICSRIINSTPKPQTAENYKPPVQKQQPVGAEPWKHLLSTAAALRLVILVTSLPTADVWDESSSARTSNDSYGPKAKDRRWWQGLGPSPYKNVISFKIYDPWIQQATK